MHTHTYTQCGIHAFAASKMFLYKDRSSNCSCRRHVTEFLAHRGTCTCTHTPTRTHTHTHTQTLSQHILSQSASHSRAERAPGSEAVNLAHVDMYLWMAYTQQSCWADQSQITFANNSQCLFFPNGEPGGRIDRISLEVNCQTPEKYFDCICKSLPVFPPKTHIVLSCKLTSPT